MDRFEGASQAGYGEKAMDPSAPTAIDRFDIELTRLQDAIERLGNRLRPVLVDHAEVELARPTPDARSPLEARVLTLSDLGTSIDRLIRDLDI